MSRTKLDLLQGTLDLLVLQTLDTMGSQHGYGLARRIEQVSGDDVLLNQGTIYASLVRLAATALDCRQVGHVGNEPAREVLHDYQGRPNPAGNAAVVLGSRDSGGRPRSRPGGRSRQVTGRWWARLLSLFKNSALDREFEDEAQSHLDLATDDYLQRGLSLTEAQTTRAREVWIHRRLEGRAS